MLNHKRYYCCLLINSACCGLSSTTNNTKTPVLINSACCGPLFNNKQHKNTRTHQLRLLWASLQQQTNTQKSFCVLRKSRISANCTLIRCCQGFCSRRRYFLLRLLVVLLLLLQQHHVQALLSQVPSLCFLKGLSKHLQ